MNDEWAVEDLVLLDLYYSGLLHGELVEEVSARLDGDLTFQNLAEQYLADWTDLLAVLQPTELIPDGAEERLITRLRAARYSFDHPKQ
ncbi:hypothetical protein [Deinococcus sedimenti]|uniref:Uncharacterized protein n=1 Tax=Deinococcus sedimenti TaxID=1867090 RepID=A0ABQ2S9H7_9DEIO|nr:hypothetical protein [Deinococcus sedimenti]GGS11264.1 hypothetical protein GCM10008960_41550 [Deinococcus sedimenti]